MNHRVSLVNNHKTKVVQVQVFLKIRLSLNKEKKITREYTLKYFKIVLKSQKPLATISHILKYTCIPMQYIIATETKIGIEFNVHNVIHGYNLIHFFYSKTARSRILNHPYAVWIQVHDPVGLAWGS